MRPLHEVLIEAASRPGVSQASRRGVLGLVAAAPLAFGLDSALAQVGAEKKNNNNNNGKQRRRQRRRDRNKGNGNGNGQSDIDILNYALTLEHLEYAFYRDGLDQFNANDFNSFGDGVFNKLEQIREHEEIHVEFLTNLIDDLGGDPVEEQCYNFDAIEENDGDFDFQDPFGFLQIARLLEDTGVMAYTGAIADIKSPELQTGGATIATVEARHASYLRLIVLDDPFPEPFDDPATMEEILAAAGGFIEGPMPCDDDNGE